MNTFFSYGVNAAGKLVRGLVGMADVIAGKGSRVPLVAFPDLNFKTEREGNTLTLFGWDVSGRVITTACVTCRIDKTGELSHFMVEHEYRNRGLGSAVLKGIIDAAKTVQLRSVYIKVKTADIQPKRLKKLLKKFGFICQNINDGKVFYAVLVLDQPF